MLPVDWLYSKSYSGDKTGRKRLVKALSVAPHESLFSTDLVITLVDSFWANFSNTLILFAFLPFILYLIVTVKYFATYINEEPKEFVFRSWETWFRCLFYVLWAYFASDTLQLLQINQMKHYKEQKWTLMSILMQGRYLY